MDNADSKSLSLKQIVLTTFICIVLLLLFIWYLVRIGNEAKVAWPPNNYVVPKGNDKQVSQENIIETETSNASKNWHNLTIFTGSGNKDTDTFKIKGNKFRLIYYIKAEKDAQEYASFTFYVFTPGSQGYVALASLDKEGTDSTVVYEGNKEYYLKIVAANLQRWEIKTEDYY